LIPRTVRRCAIVLACLAGFAVPAWARTWSDESGKFSIEAGLVSVHNGEITLKRADGKVVHLPIDKLSKADQAFLAKNSGAAKTVPPETPAATPAAERPASTNSGDVDATDRVNLKRDAKQLAATEQAVNELYKADLANAKTPQDRSALARKLIQTSETEEKPEVKFVLARKGAELAASAGDTQTTFAGMNSVEAISDDPLPVWTSCLEILLAHNPDDPVPPSGKIETLISDATVKDDYATAAKLVALLSTAAKISREPSQMATAKAKAGEVAAAKDEYKKFSVAEEQLKLNPADATAKAAAGRYLCLVRHDWDHGLPLVKDGNDKVLQPLAVAELKANKTPAELAALGDAWSAAAKKIRCTWRLKIAASIGFSKLFLWPPG
jgi:hypothetical protein